MNPVIVQAMVIAARRSATYTRKARHQAEEAWPGYRLLRTVVRLLWVISAVAFMLVLAAQVAFTLAGVLP